MFRPFNAEVADTFQEFTPSTFSLPLRFYWLASEWFRACRTARVRSKAYVRRDRTVIHSSENAVRL
jgi:hypothetical protein